MDDDDRRGNEVRSGAIGRAIDMTRDYEWLSGIDSGIGSVGSGAISEAIDQSPEFLYLRRYEQNNR